MTETAEVPAPNALNENAIWYVYAWMRADFQVFEIELGEETWGELWLDVIKNDMEGLSIKSDGDAGSGWPTIGCLNEEKWCAVVDTYIEAKLFSYPTWELEEEYEAVRADPVQAVIYLAGVGKCREYFEPVNVRPMPGAKQRLLEFARGYSS